MLYKFEDYLPDLYGKKYRPFKKTALFAKHSVKNAQESRSTSERNEVSE